MAAKASESHSTAFLPPEGKVPFFRPSIGEAEIDEIVACLRSGWLTTGPRTKRFEAEFAARVGARHALATNSCTAALHLAVNALGLRPGQAVLVPTMTFAATAAVIGYQGAFPILVDCDPVTLAMDLGSAEATLAPTRSNDLPVPAGIDVVGIVPVHVGGWMIDVRGLAEFARRHRLWIVEDAAHAFPAAVKEEKSGTWRFCGQDTSSVTCFSFYPNKTITTAEGGMAVTEDRQLAEWMRKMSLHGLSGDSWQRQGSRAPWHYSIEGLGFKYNMPDIAAAIGIHQLPKAETMRAERQTVAERYLRAFADLEELELPPTSETRIHAWHLFPIRLHLDRLNIERDEFMRQLRQRGVGCSLHWRPLHLHPHYANFGWKAEHFPVASSVWRRLISLPIFPGMQKGEVEHVIATVGALCAKHSRTRTGLT